MQNKYFECHNLIGGYGGADILHGCSIAIDKNEIVVIVGPNGAGKSTAMKAMLGMIQIKSGTISFNGNDISKLSPQDRINQGLSFVPQTNNVFTELTVRENLEIGAYEEWIMLSDHMPLSVTADADSVES